MDTAPAFNPLFFESTFVKIKLAEDLTGDAVRKANSQPTSVKFNSNQTAQNSAFYIHKDLLSSLSPELCKHIDNDVKGGLQEEIKLAEVERQTMQQFLQWAYRGDYTLGEAETARKCGKKHVDSPSTLLLHTKLYIFSNRFHIIALQNLCFARIQALLSHLKLQDDYEEDGLILLKAIRFAADNLPTVNDHLIACFLRLVAFRLKFLVVLPEFAELVHAQPEVAVSVCRLAASANTGSTECELSFDHRKPWLKKGAPGLNEMPRKSKCRNGGCTFVGFPNVKCFNSGCGLISGDARPGYSNDDWAFFTCPSCGKPEDLDEICPQCQASDFGWA
ncbi:hypothetical protein BDZ91DRAFT_800041 [Kalaharituber pfeilii]|nr:hypothetical protein BDZ91DRAFT_800041 [Kalaharituber pfeilii]